MAKFSLSRKTEEILSMGVRQLSQLPLKEQKKILKQVVQTANRRVKSLSRLDLEPTALRNLRRAGIEKFTTAGTEKQLHRQYAALQDFFYQKTSTVSGAKEVQRNIFARQAAHATLQVSDISDLSPEQLKDLNINYGGVLSDEAIEKYSKENIERFWEVFHHIEELHLDKVFNYGSPTVIKQIQDEFEAIGDWNETERRVIGWAEEAQREGTPRAGGIEDVFSAGRNTL